MSWSELVHNLPLVFMFIGSLVLAYITYKFSKLS